MNSHSVFPWRRRLTFIIVCCLLTGACADLIEIRPLRPVELSQPGRPTVVLDAANRPLAHLRGGRLGSPVALDRIAPVVAEAVIAVEDVRFRAHGGVDVRALGRAVVRNLRHSRVVEGGSTITQQLAKNSITGPARTVERKLVEASIAWQLEEQMSKDEILEHYLNTVYFGNGAYGVESAAHEYFGRPASDLTLPHAALLAGLLRSPATYDPRRHPHAARTRRNLVLGLMATHGRISEERAVTAQAAPLEVAEPTLRSWRAAYFVDHVLDILQQDSDFAFLGDTAQERAARVFAGDLRIETTLDAGWQQAAEDAVAATTPHTDDPDAAMVAIDPDTGGIRALIGGRDYFADQAIARFNLATDARRQPGSTFKPIVLASALQHGHTLDERYAAPAALRLPPVAGEPEAWQVANYDHAGYGTLDLRTATAFSVNVVYAQLIDDVGAERVATLAKELGIRSRLRPYRSLALGAEEVTVLDMASVQATLAAGGIYRRPSAISRITTADGDVLYERREPKGKRVLEQAVALQVTSALREVVESGTGLRARAGRPLAGKTGTTQDGADAWFVGYTPDMAAAVWLGFSSGRVPMTPPRTRITVEGGTWPSELFARFSLRALEQVPANDFTVPVPNVAGQPAARALQRLRRAGFDVSVTQQYSSRLPPDVVIRQHPPAGEDVVLPVGYRARLIVSTTTPVEVTVPDVLGLPADDAVAEARTAGLEPRVERRCPGDTPTCTGAVERARQVWEQFPEAGEATSSGEPLVMRVFPDSAQR